MNPDTGFKIKGVKLFALVLVLVVGAVASFAFIAKAEPGVSLSRTALEIEEGLEAKTNINLNSIPASAVTITPIFDTDLLTVTPSDVTASDTANYTFTVGARDNIDNDGNIDTTVTFDVVSDDPDYSGVSVEPLSVRIIENDIPGINVSLSSNTVLEGGGRSSGVIDASITLNTQPTTDVEVGINRKALAVANLNFDPETVTFTPSNWDQAQVIQIYPTDDSDDLGTQTTPILFVTVDGLGGSDVNYTGVSFETEPITVQDNDTREDGDDSENVLSLTPGSVSVEIGKSQTFTVALRSEAEVDFDIIISSTHGDVEVSPSTLSFSARNSTEPQTVTVTVVGKEETEDILTFVGRVCVVGEKGGDVECSDEPLSDTLVVTVTNPGRTDSEEEIPTEKDRGTSAGGGYVGGAETRGGEKTDSSNIKTDTVSSDTQSSSRGDDSSSSTSKIIARSSKILAKGIMDAEVVILQKFLNAVLISNLALDGKLGDRTKAAIETFQKGTGITTDGIVGPETKHAIEVVGESDSDSASRSLKIGARGERVRILQRLLLGRGEAIVVDGIFGPMTQSILLKFQQERAIKADGIAGPQTFLELQK